MTHDWKPSTLMGDLIPTVTFNVRLADGSLARIWAHAGHWNIRREDGTEITNLGIGAVCKWLNEEEARPIR